MIPKTISYIPLVKHLYDNNYYRNKRYMIDFDRAISSDQGLFLIKAFFRGLAEKHEIKLEKMVKTKSRVGTPRLNNRLLLYANFSRDTALHRTLINLNSSVYPMAPTHVAMAPWRDDIVELNQILPREIFNQHFRLITSTEPLTVNYYYLGEPAHVDATIEYYEKYFQLLAKIIRGHNAATANNS